VYLPPQVPEVTAAIGNVVQTGWDLIERTREHNEKYKFAPHHLNVEEMDAQEEAARMHESAVRRLEIARLAVPTRARSQIDSFLAYLHQRIADEFGTTPNHKAIHEELKRSADRLVDEIGHVIDSGR
jgi:hypothetical protein